MKKHALSLSLVLNLVLLLFFVWSQKQHEAGQFELLQASARGDHLHLEIHARAADALRNPDKAKSLETLALLDKVIAAGKENHALRVQLGIEE